jgi:hypothetical protein
LQDGKVGAFEQYTDTYIHRQPMHQDGASA